MMSFGTPAERVNFTLFTVICKMKGTVITSTSAVLAPWPKHVTVTLPIPPTAQYINQLYFPLNPPGNLTPFYHLSPPPTHTHTHTFQLSPLYYCTNLIYQSPTVTLHFLLLYFRSHVSSWRLTTVLAAWRGVISQVGVNLLALLVSQRGHVFTQLIYSKTDAASLFPPIVQKW